LRVITEIELRDQYYKCHFETFSLPDNSRLTPAAVQFLQDKNIKLKKDGPVSIRQSQGREYLLPDGKESKIKPEHMTQLKGRHLVNKRHPVIQLRGHLDSLQAQIIDTIIDFRTAGHEQIVKYLEELLRTARAVMRAEVTDEKLAEPSFMGMDSQTIREYSHYPEKHIGIKHFLPEPTHGRLMSRLNILRTAVRETELIAAQAFCAEDGSLFRSDIMQTLNRMSSMVYIIMCQLLAGKYTIG
jgi:ethanolamine utilization cobalamin adenosyltransferase